MFRKLFIVSLAVLLTACGAAETRHKLGNLDHAIDEYAYALRWQRIDDAVAFHKRKDGTKPNIDTSTMNNVRVTGFKIDKRILSDDMTSATVTGELDYYKEDVGTLHKLHFEQHWWYDEDAKHWYLSSDFPKFK